MKRAAFFIPFLFCITVWSQSNELVEKSFTGVSSQKTPQAARRDIIEQATKKVSDELIISLIGEDRFLKNKTAVQNKVERLSNRYIPLSKPSELIEEAGGYKMTVTLKVSLRDLKTLLQENSLLVENETAPVVLPLVAFSDKVNFRNYRWWKAEDSEGKAFLISQNRHFENALRTAFQKFNFYLIKGSALGPQVPASVQNERLSLDDMQLMNQYFGAPLVVEGGIHFLKNPDSSNRYRIEIKLEALQVSNGRPIADVSRRFDAEVGVFESVIDKKFREVIDAASVDLASQVYEAWQRGTVGANVIRLSFLGRVPLNQQESFKEKLRAQIPQIRSIRERMISFNNLVYEIDTNISAKEFSTKVHQVEIDGKKWNAQVASDSEVTMQVQR